MEIYLNELSGLSKLNLLAFLTDIQALKILSGDGIPLPISKSSEDNPPETIYYDDQNPRRHDDFTGYPLFHDGFDLSWLANDSESLDRFYAENSPELSGLNVDCVIPEDEDWFLLLYAGDSYEYDGISFIIQGGEIWRE